LEQNKSDVSVHILDEVARLSKEQQDEAIQGVKDGTFKREDIRALSKVNKPKPTLFDELKEVSPLPLNEISPAELSKHQHQYQDLKFVYLVNDGASFNAQVWNFFINPKFCTNKSTHAMKFRFSSKYRVTIECLED
jgi:hypothetical protein